MDVYKTHGAFSWSELMTPDPAAATAFYGALFGWTVQTSEMGGEGGEGGEGAGPHHMMKIGDTAVGGVMGLPPGAPAMPSHWGCYVTVDNVEASVAKCSALGGKTLVPPMDVPGVGRMAVIQDPQGATLSLMAYSM